MNIADLDIIPDILGQLHWLMGVSTTSQRYHMKIQLKGSDSNIMKIYSVLRVFGLRENCILRRFSHFLWLYFLRLNVKVTIKEKAQQKAECLSYRHTCHRHLHNQVLPDGSKAIEFAISIQTHKKMNM